jgi:ubiquinone/menaquinone biosynthesis C-methylase UbiE
MDASEANFYRAPESLSRLRLDGGKLVSEDGHQFEIENGVPNLLWPARLRAEEERTKTQYDQAASQIYAAAMQWQFAALYEDEAEVREKLVDLLEPQPDHRVLEVSCGTGRDSFRIARRLGPDGAFFAQDLSSGMVHACVDELAKEHEREPFACERHFSISNALYLPFPDDCFDSVFHFGGFNEFVDKKKAASEFARVVKPGGIVVVGDESVGPWLRGTEFGNIVTTNNRLFANELPIDTLPESARDVAVRWIMANCFYVITFRKGDGPPPLDLDLPHKGWRGGTMRSRYFGVLEGVTPEAKELAREAAARAGMSVHEWLDSLVRRQAASELSGSTRRRK